MDVDHIESDSAAPSPTPTLSTRSDGELLAELAEDPQSPALAELVRRHQIGVFRHLATVLADPDEAERLSEKVFLLALTRADEGPSGKGDTRPWLIAIADELAEGVDGSPTSDDPRFADPSFFFRNAVHRAMASLPEQQRELLLRVDLEGQTPAEAGKALGLSGARVTETLDLARQSFQAAFENPSHAPTFDASQAPTQDPAENVEGVESGASATVNEGDLVDRRYRVRTLLGRGGMGAVFRAEHVAIKREVALKTIHTSLRRESMVRARFRREAEVLGKLHHKNFVDVSDFGESGAGVPFLIMELLDGHPLSDEMEAGPLPVDRALFYVGQVLDGLAFAHAEGIVHRDIKPDNIVVVGEETGAVLKILDLGIATAAGPVEEEELYGTPAYMAPEQIQGSLLDGRADLYAVGVMLFEMLTGELPFDANSPQYMLALHISKPPPKLVDMKSDLEGAEVLQAILDRMLGKEPSERFRSAEDARRAVDEAVRTLGLVEGAELSIPSIERKESSLAGPTAPTEVQRGTGARRLALFAMPLLVVLGALLAYWLTRS